MALAKLQRKPFGEDRSHVAEAHGDVREGKTRANFRNKIHCKLQDIMKNTPDFPGTTQVNHFREMINSFALAKTTFFQNAQNAGAAFPPTGCYSHPSHCNSIDFQVHTSYRSDCHCSDCPDCPARRTSLE